MLTDVWLEVTHNDRLVVVLNFDNMVKARPWCKRFIDHLWTQGVKARVSYHWVRPDTGMFEVHVETWETDPHKLIEIATNPPISNRGVTGFRKGEKSNE